MRKKNCFSFLKRECSGEVLPNLDNFIFTYNSVLKIKFAKNNFYILSQEEEMAIEINDFNASENVHTHVDFFLKI